MRRKFRFILIIALLALFNLLIGATAKPVTAQMMQDKSKSAKQADFQTAMRKLWEDHITWTRLFIVSATANLPDKDATTNRLLQNQVDIGNAVKLYYGDAAGNQLTTLLKEHITTAAELVTAAKANDTAKMEDAKKRWFANADQIASFLSKANPKNWSNAEMQKMMHDHLNLTTTEVQARLKGDWAADIAAYERVHGQILHMADMLSAGIINQFPEKFK
jgi:hypothetical protein